MKRLIICTGLALGLVAYSGETTSDETSDLVPLINMYGEDSLDVDGNIVYGKVDHADMDKESEENLGYTLGPISDIPLVNMYGEDSTDADGNFVYPMRDTLYN